jgi:hypothetical protein
MSGWHLKLVHFFFVPSTLYIQSCYEGLCPVEVAILSAATMVTMTTRDTEMFALSIHLYKTVATLKPQAIEV